MASFNIALIAFLTTIVSCEALQCYDCRSDADPGCGENLNTGFNISTCTDTYCGIGKTTTNAYPTVYLRVCLPDASIFETNECGYLTYNGLPVYGCSCSRSLCNVNFNQASPSSSVKKYADAYALLATSAAVVLFAKLRG